jgi:stress response protein YsnF
MTLEKDNTGMKTISRLYKDYDTGARVVDELERSGIPHDDISIVANNESGWFDRDRTSPRVDRDHDGRDDRAEGAAAGAGIGATLGGVAGLLAGLGMLAIPGIGPVVAAGWLASTAAIAAAGGTAGGLIGALTQAGHGENEARTYAEGVQRGGTLVTARVDDSRAATVEAIMQRYDDRTGSSTMGAAHREGTTGTAYHEDWSGDRIVAVFENTERAATVRQALIGDGIDNARMELIDRRSDLDNWAAMKQHALPDEDTHLFAESLGRGHAILVIRAASGEHDRVMRVLSRFNPIDIEEHAQQWRTAGWSGVHPGKAAWDVHRQNAAARNTATTTAATSTAPTTSTTVATTASTTSAAAVRSATEVQEEVIPVYEEELRVGKRVIEQGRVRVHAYTVEQPVQKDLTLREERVEVEHRPVDRPVSGIPGEAAFQDRTIDVTTHREEPVIDKEARIKEEIVVRKEADQHTETVRDTVRHTEVEIEDDRARTTTPANPSTIPPRR